MHRYLSGATVGIVLGVGATLILRTFLASSGLPKEEPANPIIVNMLVEEVLEVKRQFASLKNGSIEAATAEKIDEQIGEIEKRLVQVSAEATFRNELIELNAGLTNQALSLTNQIVTAVAFFFTIAVAAVGFLSFGKFQDVKLKMEEQQAALASLSGQVENERNDLNKLVDEISKERQALKNFAEQSSETISRQERSLAATRDFLDAMQERFFSVGLVEVFSALREAKVISPEIDSTLRRKAAEVKARLCLWHPDEQRVGAAIDELNALGTLAAIPDLEEFRRGPRSSESQKAATERAIRAIRERGRKEPKGGVPTDGEGGSRS